MHDSEDFLSTFLIICITCCFFCHRITSFEKQILQFSSENSIQAFNQNNKLSINFNSFLRNDVIWLNSFCKQLDINRGSYTQFDKKNYKYLSYNKLEMILGELKKTIMLFIKII